MKRILIACECSGVVRDAFNSHDNIQAVSCDLQPSTGAHLQCDVLSVLDDGWDAMIAHPPCTYLSSSGLHWIARGRIESDGRPRSEHYAEALAFARALMDAPIALIAIENPTGAIGSQIRPADQWIQPFEFGDDASKKTGLWLKGLPPLRKDPSRFVSPRLIDGRPRWSNQTDSGQNKLTPSPDRGALRSVTYPGIARAMAGQWSPIINR